MMNRDKIDRLPAMQVEFIDSICLPVYEAFAIQSDALLPLKDECLRNRLEWVRLAQNQKEKWDCDQNNSEQKTKS